MPANAASPRRVNSPGIGNGNAGRAVGTATSMAGELPSAVPISFTYGSAAPPSAGLHYEPPAKVRARERVIERQQSQSRRSESVNASDGGASSSAAAAAIGESEIEGTTVNTAGRGAAASSALNNRKSNAGAAAATASTSKSLANKPSTHESMASSSMAGNAGTSSGSGSTRARGASFLQTHPTGDGFNNHGNSNKSSSLKDTSVNIATAFRQAVAKPASSGAAASFLGRAGDRPAAPPLSYIHDNQAGNEYSGEGKGEAEDDDLSFAESTKETQHLGQFTNSLAGSTASKKRKKQQYKGVKEKDEAFRISKAELNAPDSEDEDFSGEEEEEYSEGGSRRPPGDRSRIAKARKRTKKAKAAAPASDGEGASDPAVAAATKKAKTARRKSGTKDPAYKPGQDSDSEENISEEIDEARQKVRKSLGPRRVPAAGTGISASTTSRKGSAALSESEEPGSRQNVTSFYLQAPSSEADDQSNDNFVEPQFKTREQAHLTQVHPKSSNGGTTYQPYFAFSTTTTSAGGNNKRFTNTSTTATLARAAGHGHQRNASLGSTSQATESSAAGGGAQNQSNGLLGDITRETGPSSNASFENRGSEYDYAEEEAMTAALLAAKQRGETGRRLPEGRPFSDLVQFTGAYDFSMRTAATVPDSSVNGRDMSLAPSEGSSSIAADALAHQQQKKLGPKRAPAPPGPSGLRRSPSVLSDSQAGGAATGPSLSGSVNTDAQNRREDEASRRSQKLPTKSVGRRLGEITRAVLLALYWLTIGPVKAAIRADWPTLGKWAAAVALLGLMLGSMIERASNTPDHQHNQNAPYWLWPFSNRNAASQPAFRAPTTLPANLEELVSRLSNLETSFTSLSSSAAADRSSLHSASSLLDDSSRRLQYLESEFEAEKRKAAKALSSSEKKSDKDVKELEASLKGVKSQLDYLGDKVKSLNEGKKEDALQNAKSQRDVEALQGQLEGLKKSYDGLNRELRNEIQQISLEGGKQTTDEAALKRLIAHQVEKTLPARMAVSLDSKSGDVRIDPRFMEHLKAAFASSGSSTAPSWEQFLASNKQDLYKLLDERLDAEAKKGAMLSKPAVLEIIEKEISAVRSELSRSSSEGLARLSSEVSSKINKLSSQQQASKAQTLKLSSGEDLTAIIGTLVDSALDRYSKDVLARPDFALFSSGARVIPSLTSPTYEIRPSTWTGSLLSKITGTGTLRGKPPVTALHPDINVGQCWPFAGQTGQLGIMLSRKILPTDVTIEHAAKEVALDVSSAPRQFEVWGLVEDQEGLERLAALRAAAGEEAEDAVQQAAPNRLLLVSGEYDVSAEKHIQTFSVPQEVQDLHIPVSVVLLRVLSNHGNEVLSCVYRLRVGGTLVEETNL